MPVSRRKLLAGIGSSATALAGCAGTQDSPSQPGTLNVPPAGVTYAYTHQQPSGNRVVSGRGAIDGVQSVDIEVEGRPVWLLAFGDTVSYWTVITADGTATTHRLSDAGSEIVGRHERVSSPPLAYRTEKRVEFVDTPGDCAEHTHPVVIDDGLLYVADDGDVIIWRESGRSRLEVNAPEDVRLVELRDGRYALYGAQTDRYRHGALGDTTEGSSLLVVDVATETIEVEVTLDSQTVFEGLSPLVADIDGDGEAELITTVADSDAGARIRVYGTDGTELATGPIYGSGWRHQLCVAPFGPADLPELAVVRKPHVDRTVEFYRLAGGELEVTATAQGYASHTYGSRNLDGGLAADLDSDGLTELLVPTTDRQRLTALRRVDTGVVPSWSLPLDGSLVTNVTGIALEGDRIAVGAGTIDGVRVWQG